MKQQNKYIRFVFLVGFSALFFYSQSNYDKHWSKQETGRSPSSLKIFENRDPQLYQDYFSENKKMKIEFWTNRDEESIKKRARLALHTAISETLLNKDAKGVSKDLFKSNLIKSFSDKFLKSLYLLKIMNGTFQIDLHFSHEEISTFNQLMKTNQLIDSSQTGTLLSSLEDKKISFTKNIIEKSTPIQDERYRNLGGTITLWFKVLDLNWNPLNPIPNPPKNAVKGFVKYRRYFQVKKDWNPIIPLKTIQSELEVKWKNNEKPAILTVDLTKTFNLGSMVPKAESLEIHFGLIKPPKHFKTGPLASLNLFSKDERVNKLLLFGNSGSGKNTKSFELEVSKLSFLLEENKFSQSSRIRSHGNWSGYNIVKKRKFKSSLKHALLGDDAFEFIKNLHLDRFHQGFKEVKSK